MLVFVDGGGHGHDVHATTREIAHLGGETQAGRGAQLFGAHFQRAVFAGLQLGHAGGVDVEAGDGVVFAKFGRQGQAHVAEANDGDVGV